MICMNSPRFSEISLSDFAYVTQDKVRYADTDRQGHVNNSVFSTFFETGRVELLYDPKSPLADPGCSFVVAGIQMDLLSPLFWPGIVDIGLSVIRIGTSSIHFSQALFQNGKIAARAETVVVQVDDHSSRSRFLSERILRKLHEFSRLSQSE